MSKNRVPIPTGPMKATGSINNQYQQLSSNQISSDPYSKLREVLPNYLNVGDSFDKNDPQISIQQHKQNKANRITQNFRNINDRQYKNEESNVGPLFRFYSGTPSGLQSLAQRQNQGYLPQQAMDRFTSGHMNANEKAIKSNQTGKTYYSPFVSTTNSLPDFLNTSFSMGGDKNIRNDVFQRSPQIGVFSNIPQKYTTAASSKLQNNQLQSSKLQDNQLTKPNLPYQEREVVFDTSKGANLGNYLNRRHNNPLLNQIQPDLMDLYMSRGGPNNKNIDQDLKGLISDYSNLVRKIPKDQRLNTQERNDFRDLRKGGQQIEDYLANISTIPEPKGYDIGDKPNSSQIADKLRGLQNENQQLINNQYPYAPYNKQQRQQSESPRFSPSFDMNFSKPLSPQQHGQAIGNALTGLNNAYARQFAKGGRVNHDAGYQRHLDNLQMIREYLNQTYQTEPVNRYERDKLPKSSILSRFRKRSPVSLDDIIQGLDAELDKLENEYQDYANNT